MTMSEYQSQVTPEKLMNLIRISDHEITDIRKSMEEITNVLSEAKNLMFSQNSPHLDPRYVDHVWNRCYSPLGDIKQRMYMAKYRLADIQHYFRNPPNDPETIKKYDYSITTYIQKQMDDHGIIIKYLEAVPAIAKDAFYYLKMARPVVGSEIVNRTAYKFYDLQRNYSRFQEAISAFCGSR